MRSSVVASVLAFVGLAAAGVFDKRNCIADNCLRALTGTGSNDRTSRPVIARSDCSTYLSTLVYTTLYPTLTSSTTIPSTSVISTTATSIVTVTVPEAISTTTSTTTETSTTIALQKRATRTIPAYASACSGAVRYSSACSCFGFLPLTSTSTIYVSATTTITYTTTTSTTAITTETDTTSTTTSTTLDITTTTTAAATATCTIFKLTSTFGGGSIIDYFFVNKLFFYYTGSANGINFAITASGQLIDFNTGYVTVVDTTSSVLSTVDPSNIPAGTAPITCQISPTNYITCEEGTFTMLEYDTRSGYYQLILGDGSISGDQVVDLLAIPAC